MLLKGAAALLACDRHHRPASDDVGLGGLRAAMLAAILASWALAMPQHR